MSDISNISRNSQLLSSQSIEQTGKISPQQSNSLGSLITQLETGSTIPSKASQLQDSVNNSLLISKALALAGKLSQAQGKENIPIKGNKTVPTESVLNDLNRLIGIINDRIQEAQIPSTSSLDKLDASTHALSGNLKSSLQNVSSHSLALSQDASQQSRDIEALKNTLGQILTQQGLPSKSLSLQSKASSIPFINPFSPGIVATPGQRAVEKMQQFKTMNTEELMSFFLMNNINNMKELVVMLSEGSRAFTNYITACNTLMEEMTAAQGNLLSDPNATVNGRVFEQDMQQLGFPNCSMDSDWSMNAQQISGNLTIISNGVQVATQKSNQLTTELSQVNQMLQQWLKFASNTLQGNSRMVSSIYNNI